MKNTIRVHQKSSTKHTSAQRQYGQQMTNSNPPVNGHNPCGCELGELREAMEQSLALDMLFLTLINNSPDGSVYSSQIQGGFFSLINGTHQRLDSAANRLQSKIAATNGPVSEVAS
jgi:hypothetical protein